MHSKFVSRLFIGIFFFLLPQRTLQTTPESLYYVGAVVEYHSLAESTESSAIADVQNFEKIIKKAKELNSNLDIIVFPENGVLSDAADENKSIEELRKLDAIVASYIPKPSEKVTPCGDNNTKVSEPLKILSCAAKKYKVYVVVNYLEKEDCTNCAKDKLNLFNSNVVFDRSGTIISRYRKYNLFTEPSLNITSEPELSTFETDFGVKFGQFICFDILFKTPALELLKKLKVTDIVYPLHWYAELPFLDALSVQTAWSYANNVNLLSSGNNYPATGATGSGIFAGNSGKIPGVFRSDINKNALLIANVPKLKDGVRADVKNETILHEFSDDEISTIKDKGDIHFMSDFIGSFSTVLVNPQIDQFLTLCNNDFCCYFNHKTESDQTVVKSRGNYYRYRFGIFAGVRSFAVVNGGVQVCGLMACTNDDLSSCGKKFDAKDTFKNWMTFKKLEIVTQLPRRENVTLLSIPISLQTNFMPLNPVDMSFQTNPVKNVDYDFVSLSLNEPKENLMSFGVYIRNFSADGSKTTTTTLTSSTSSLVHSPFVISIVIILILLGFQSKI